MERLRQWNEIDPMREFTAAFVASRGRFIDDRLLESLADGTRQIVIVGAGMDARAFRLDLSEDVVVYELDQFDVLEWEAVVLQPGDEGANFDRWRLKAPPRSEREIPRSFLISADKLAG